MVYFGPIHLARRYFIDMGYIPANRQTTPDFLVSLTDPLGRTMNDTGLDLRNHPIPQTALEFEEYYKNSEIMKMNLQDIRLYKEENVDKPDRKVAYKESAKAEHARHTRRTVSNYNSVVVALFMIDFTEPIHDFDSNASANRHASQDTDRSRGFYSSSAIDNVSDDCDRRSCGNSFGT
jgi:ATP-binding cassette subfamily G (WHITE) protein 2 (SNQ2)